MKFLNKMRKLDIQKMRKHHLELCPYTNTCLPVSYHVGTNKAGICAGLIEASPNLDCIRLCVFYEIKRKVKILEHFFTPDEAMDTIHSLALTVRESLDSNSDYKKYYKELCKARRNGDEAPANL